MISGKTSLKYYCGKHVAFNAPFIGKIPSNGPGRKSHKARTVESQTVQPSPLIRTRTWSSTRHHIFPSQTSSSRSRPNASKSCGLTFEIENYFNRALRANANVITQAKAIDSTLRIN